MTDYNQLFNTYHFTKTNPVKQFSEEYTFLKVLGSVTNKRVLDMACGDGYYTRMIKKHGAAHVVGIDISEKMIHEAQVYENQTPQGIEYHVSDVCQERQFGEFDCVISIYLFPYANSKQMLSQMCKSMAKNLKQGGRMVAVLLNPFLKYNYLDAQKQYHVQMHAQPPLIDGSIIHVNIHTPQAMISLDNYFWSKDVYEELLVNAGFYNIEWHFPEVSEKGIAAYGEDFWEAHLTKPGFAVLTCEHF